MKVKAIHIKNFRSIWDLRIPNEGELKDLVVFIGPNNSGKSNILRALRIALELFDSDTLKTIQISNPWFFNYTAEPSTIEILLSLDDSEKEKILSSLEGIEEISSIRLKVELFSDGNQVKWKLSELQLFGFGYGGSVVELAREFYEEVAGKKDPAEVKPFSIVQDGKILSHKAFEAIVSTIGKDSGKIKYIYTGKDVYDLDQIPISEQLLENIRSICDSPLRRDFIKRLEMVKDASGYSRDGQKIYYENEEFPIQVFGSGSLAFDAILASLLMAKYSHSSCIVLIEEPENHLHPDLVREMAVLLEEVTEEKKLQIFVVTHSPEFVDALSDRSVVILVKKSVEGPHMDPATIAVPLKGEDEFTYLAMELGSRLFFANVLILVEGGDDECLLKYWINRSRKDLPNLRKYSVGIIPFAQKFKGEGLVNLVEILKKRLRLDVYVILDGDEEGKNQREQLEEKGFADITFNWSKPDILAFIEPSKIEEAIQNACKSLGIEIEENARKRYEELLKEVKEMNKKAYIDLLNLLEDVSGIKIPEIKRRIGLELIKLKPEVHPEVKGILSQIDMMIGRG